MPTPMWRALRAIRNLVAGSAATSFEGLRDFARADVDTEVVVFHDGQSYAGRLRDVSISGAMLESGCDLPIGVEMELELTSIPGRVRARVMRHVKKGFGIQFSNANAGLLIAGWSRGTSPGDGASPPRRVWP